MLCKYVSLTNVLTQRLIQSRNLKWRQLNKENTRKFSIVLCIWLPQFYKYVTFFVNYVLCTGGSMSCSDGLNIINVRIFDLTHVESLLEMEHKMATIVSLLWKVI
jgi:hypothetical protein